MKISLLCVTFKDEKLISRLIKSFEKFKPKDLEVQYVIVENTSDTSHKEYVTSLADDVLFINNSSGEDFNLQSGNTSMGHGLGYEAGKKHLKNDLTFVCHSDCIVTSSEFFTEFLEKAEEGFELIGVCFDAHPGRVLAIHCSGYLVKTEILKKTSMLPELPKIDTTDKVTEHCRSKGLEIFCFRNTYNNKELSDLINEPYRSLGRDCGIDRCLSEKSNNVIYMHQGRGTSKLFKRYFKPGKVDTESWLKICDKILED